MRKILKIIFDFEFTPFTICIVAYDEISISIATLTHVYYSTQSLFGISYDIPSNHISVDLFFIHIIK